MAQIRSGPHREKAMGIVMRNQTAAEKINGVCPIVVLMMRVLSAVR
jgi:hypothetical protein